MKAFVSYINPLNGRDELGTSLQWVTPTYQSIDNLNHYFLMNPAKPTGRYHVQAYRNWDNKYGTPDYDYVYEKHSYQSGYISPSSVQIRS